MVQVLIPPPSYPLPQPPPTQTTNKMVYPRIFEIFALNIMMHVCFLKAVINATPPKLITRQKRQVHVTEEIIKQVKGSFISKRLESDQPLIYAKQFESLCFTPKLQLCEIVSPVMGPNYTFLGSTQPPPTRENTPPPSPLPTGNHGLPSGVKIIHYNQVPAITLLNPPRCCCRHSSALSRPQLAKRS